MVDISRSFVFFVALLSVSYFALSCVIKIDGRSPLFIKYFGSQRMIFKSPKAIINLEEGETINAFCKGMQATASDEDFIPFEDDPPVTFSANGNIVTFYCESNKIRVDKHSYQYIHVFCPPYPRLRLYESNRKLPKCVNYESYAIGAKFPVTGDEVIKAGICYDLERLELKFVSYVTSEKSVGIKMQFNNNLTLSLNEEVNGFNKYFDFVSQISDYVHTPTMKSIFNANEFDFESLLQDETLQRDLKDFSYLFGTLWWRQLRQENWRLFLDALNERTQTTKYVVNVGTFGNVTIPTTNGNCSSQRSEIVSKSTVDMTVKAPGYIWAYLRSITPGVDEEFVVIGHNSPYKKNPDHSEFCATDMCDEIGWLKSSDFGNLRRLSALGYTFCCRPEDVSKVIDYFPLNPNEIEIATTTATIPEYNWYHSPLVEK